MKRYIALLLLTSLTVLGVYVYQRQSGYPDISSVEFTLLDGRHINVQQLRGKPILVSFWATTCASCLQEIPDLIRLYDKHSPQGLEIIAVAMPYDRPDHVLEMARARKLPYPVALDIDARIARAFGNVRVTPHHFLIDTDGSIIKHQIGIIDIPATEQLLQTL